MKEDLKIIPTSGQETLFIQMCRELDASLDEIVGGPEKREQYCPFNQLDEIHQALVLFKGEQPVASGGFKHFDHGIAEIKRVFVKPEYRGLGFSRILMAELEKKAQSQGYQKLILETGDLLVAASGLYRSLGYQIRENYPPYVGMVESVCMEKSL